MSTLLLTLALALIGCTDKDSSGTDTGPAGGDAGATGDGGTADGGSSTGIIDVSLATTTTTAVVTWPLSDGVTDASVTFGVEGDRSWTVDATVADGTASAMLIGLRPGLEHVITASELQHDTDTVIDTTTITAGTPPGTLPGADYVVVEDGRHEKFMVSSVLSSPSTPVIMNDQGEFVWWHEPIFEDHVVIRAWLQGDGSGVQYMSRPNPGGGEVKETWLVKVDWTGDDIETIALDDAHHDFLEMPDGTIAYLAEDRSEQAGATYVGDRIMLLSPDGTETQLWSVWDTYNVKEDTPDDVEGTSWSHANAIDYDADANAFYVSLRNFNAIVGIDAATGERFWQFGGEESNYAPMLSDEFNWQHQFEWLDDGSLLVFDNGNTDRFYSRATVYSFDDDLGTAEVTWQHTADPPTFCYGPGDVHLLDNGNTIVTWGSSGRIQEVGTDGGLLSDNLFGVGGALGYTTFVDDLNAL